MKTAPAFALLISLGISACAPEENGGLSGKDQNKQNERQPSQDEESPSDRAIKAAQTKLTQFFTDHLGYQVDYQVDDQGKPAHTSQQASALLATANELRRTFAAPNFSYESNGHHYTSDEICRKLTEIIASLRPDTRNELGPTIGKNRKRLKSPPYDLPEDYKVGLPLPRIEHEIVDSQSEGPPQKLEDRYAQFLEDYQGPDHAVRTLEQARMLLGTAIRLHKEYSTPSRMFGMGGEAPEPDTTRDNLNHCIESLQTEIMSVEFTPFLKKLYTNFSNPELVSRIILAFKARHDQNDFEGEFLFKFGSSSQNSGVVRIDLNKFLEQLLIARRFASHSDGTSGIFHNLLLGKMPTEEELLQARLTLYLSDYENDDKQSRTVGQAQFLRRTALELSQKFRQGGYKTFKQGKRYWTDKAVLNGLERHIKELDVLLGKSL